MCMHEYMCRCLLMQSEIILCLSFSPCSCIKPWENSFSFILKGCLLTYMTVWSACTGYIKCTFTILWGMPDFVSCGESRHTTKEEKMIPNWEEPLVSIPKAEGHPSRGSQALENKREKCNYWLPTPTALAAQGKAGSPAFHMVISVRGSHRGEQPTDLVPSPLKGSCKPKIFNITTIWVSGTTHQ